MVLLNMAKKTQLNFVKQIKDNAIALISLFIAISSLSYNSWRNELTEDNRNQRFAAFEIILKINELQQVVFYNHYEKDLEHKGNPRLGWTYALTIRDLAMVLPTKQQLAAQSLVDTWSDNWQTLHKDMENKNAIDLSIDAMRDEIVELLASLD